MPSRPLDFFRLACALFVAALAAPAARAQGPLLAGAGPVNRSMGGAAVASPLDATGTLYWNPAAIGGLRSSELDLGLELLYPRSSVASTIPRGALGPGGPPATLSGTTRDEAGVFPLPTGGFVYKPDESRWTFGVGVFPAAGFGTNYPGSPSNPVLSPPPPGGAGLGHVSSEYQLLQVAPTAAYRLGDNLYVGFAPTIDIARLAVTPGVFFAPDDANRDGAAHYPAATSTRDAWGAGFQAGVYYVASADWRVGASVKSKQWFEPFRFQVTDELGRPRTVRFNLDAPLIVSAGAAFTGVERLTVAADVRYINFRDTSGLRASGFDPTGAVAGLGWKDVFALALGGQYVLTDALAVRVGYTFNTDPIPAGAALLNVASPLSYQHQLAVGASYQLTPACVLSAAYYHVFFNSVTGPYLTPAGPVPGATVTPGVVADSVVFGASVRF